MNRGGGRSGFWPALSGVLIGAGCLYGYMSWQGDARNYVDLQYAEDFADFLEEEGERDPPVPFKAQPLEVKGKGEVKAIPDIAVITALIREKDTLESRAVNIIAERVNAVQKAVDQFDAETSVVDSQTSRQYDAICQSENQEARRRHNQINNDYWFNRRLDERGDTETKRREPKPRIAQKICNVQSIEARTQLVIRVAPPDAAGDILQALADNGADETRLYGYDFSNYDDLYQQAAAQAVSRARAKADMIARHAKAELGDITAFYVGRPARTGRFGPQPTIINKSSGRTVSRGAFTSSPPPPRAPNIVDRWDGISADEIVVTGRRISTINGRDLDKQFAVDDESDEDLIPTSSNNALQMSLHSGPQTIRVSAILAYDYKTVIDGSLVPNDD